MTANGHSDSAVWTAERPAARPGSPGTTAGLDDPRVHQAMEEYLKLLQAGERPDRDAFLAAYPDVTAALAACLQGLDFIHAAGAELCNRATGGGSPTGRFSNDPVEPAEPLGDFRIIREVGRGGMGVVYEAEQISLGRRVALKLLPYAGALDARQLQRFKNEAKAAASLRHEHIVQVHAIGCERGVHYYAMEFIEGQTLAQIIAAMAPNEAGPVGEATQDFIPAPDVPTRPVAALSTERSGPRGREFRRRAAALIADAAEALEYAHSMGIVHRDVKPGNLMVDVAGKLWVTDFGLARFGTDAGLTMSGDLLGTLRYMAPEQAMARHGLADHRVDVYGLGCTLYELLTGRPAVRGEDKADIVRHIAFEEPVAPRKLDKNIPAEMETIALKCLAKNPVERYATAVEMAADLRRWLEDKPIRAKPPALRQRLARWARRHPAVTAAFGLVAGLLIAGSFALERETKHAEAAVQAVAAQADQLRESGRLPEALRAARHAADLLPRFGGDAALRLAAEERVADMQLLNRREEARLEEAQLGAGEKFDHRRADALFRRAFQEYGVDVLCGNEAGVVAALKGRAAVADIAVGLGEWARLRNLDPAEKERLRRLADALDADPRQMMSRVCRAAEAEDVAALKQLALEAEADLPHPSVVCRLGNELRWFKAYAEAERLLRAGQERYPADYWMNHRLGTLFLDIRPRRAADGIPFATAALALRPYSPVAWCDLGTLQSLAGKNQEGAASYRSAIALDPSCVTAYINLADNLLGRGQYTDAEAAARRAVVLSPDQAEGHVNLGSAFDGQKKWKVAEAEFRRAIALNPDLAVAHLRLARLLIHLDRYNDAERAFRVAIKLAPDDANTRLALSAFLALRGRNAQAESELNKATGPASGSVEYYVIRAGILYRLGRYAEAAAAYRDAIRLDPKDPRSHAALGQILRRARQFDESLAAYRKALSLASQRPDEKVLSQQLARVVHDAQQLVNVAPRLSALVSGETRPANADEYAVVALDCMKKNLNAAAARAFAAAFTADPNLAEMIEGSYRYDAACAAALAGCGTGEDAAKLDADTRAGLRRNALDWLNANYAEFAKRAETPADRPMIRKAMQHWQQDSDFAGVRDAAALAKLPEAERVAWKKLWADVAALEKQCDQSADASKPNSP